MMGATKERSPFSRRKTNGAYTSTLGRIISSSNLLKRRAFPLDVFFETILNDKVAMFFSLFGK